MKHLAPLILFPVLLAQLSAAPTADEIVAKVIEASGGKEKLESVTTRKMEGSLVMGAAGQSFQVTVFQKAPDKKYVKLEAGGQVVYEEGVNGEMAWKKDPNNGVVELQGAEREQKIHGARFHDGIEMIEEAEWSFKEQKEVDGEDVLVLNGTSASGYPASAFTYLIDAGNYYGKRMEYESEVEGNIIPLRVEFGDYEKVDGISYPFSMEILVNLNPFISVQFDKVSHGVEIEDSLFEMPAN